MDSTTASTSLSSELNSALNSGIPVEFQLERISLYLYQTHVLKWWKIQCILNFLHNHYYSLTMYIAPSTLPNPFIFLPLSHTFPKPQSMSILFHFCKITCNKRQILCFSCRQISQLKQHRLTHLIFITFQFFTLSPWTWRAKIRYTPWNFLCHFNSKSFGSSTSLGQEIHTLPSRAIPIYLFILWIKLPEAASGGGLEKKTVYFGNIFFI